MVGPEAFFEVRYLQHYKQLEALTLIPALAQEFEAVFGRQAGGLVRGYKSDGAETVVVALGSVNGTIKDVVDEMRVQGASIGSLSICSYRPFPLEEVKAALRHAKRVIVVEKCMSVGLGGIVSADVRKALAGTGVPTFTAVAGLGGRPIPSTSLHKLLSDLMDGKLEQLTFLDLNWDVVNREVARMKEHRRSGPTAENILRDLGSAAVSLL